MRMRREKLIPDFSEGMNQFFKEGDDFYEAIVARTTSQAVELALKGSSTFPLPFWEQFFKIWTIRQQVPAGISVSSIATDYERYLVGYPGSLILNLHDYRSDQTTRIVWSDLFEKLPTLFGRVSVNVDNRRTGGIIQTNFDLNRCANGIFTLEHILKGEFPRLKVFNDRILGGQFNPDGSVVPDIEYVFQ